MAAKQKWISQARIEGAAIVNLSSVLFWIWGLIGLAVNGLYFLLMPSGVGVGTSAYVAACIMFWIGGMVLFGIGALLRPTDYEFKRPVEPTEPSS
jgi:hypothetical protein